MLNKKNVMIELKKVIDPEIGIPITEMKLIDDVKIDKGNVMVEFHLSTPLCPSVFATKIASDIRDVVSKIRGIRTVKVKLTNHYQADYINNIVNK